MSFGRVGCKERGEEGRGRDLSVAKLVDLVIDLGVLSTFMA